MASCLPNGSSSRRILQSQTILSTRWLKRSWGGEVRNISVLVAVGVNEAGYREILGIEEGIKEDGPSWKNFLVRPKERGLRGTRLFISDKCMGLLEGLGEVFPHNRWQRCCVHFYRKVFSLIPRGRMREVAAMLKAIHAQEDRKETTAKVATVIGKLREMKLAKAADLLEKGAVETPFLLCLSKPALATSANQQPTGAAHA